MKTKEVKYQEAVQRNIDSIEDMIKRYEHPGVYHPPIWPKYQDLLIRVAKGFSEKVMQATGDCDPTMECLPFIRGYYCIRARDTSFDDTIRGQTIRMLKVVSQHKKG